MEYILVDSPALGFERILKQITHMGISKSITFTKTSITSVLARYSVFFHCETINSPRQFLFSLLDKIDPVV